MDYKKVNDSIIARALARKAVDGYTEKHHIIARSKGGTHERSNLRILCTPCNTIKGAK